MIDPVLYTIQLGNFQFSIYWYGVIVVASILIGTWIASLELRRRGGNPDYLWDGLVWAIPAGLIGARLWYVVTDILGGDSRYLQDPLSIVKIHEGGLHFYGAVLFGALAFYLYARRHKLDMWLVLDSAAPGLLIGQGTARIANFINQELYGPPTSLPWGIPIDATHRISPYYQLDLYPEATTRFHPAFAYEMLYNYLAAGFLMWFWRRNEAKMRPGAVFAGWLILAGIGRQIIEFYRPDQPRLPGTEISYSRITAALMILVGVLLLLIKYEVIHLPFLKPPRTEYTFPPTPVESQEESEENESEEQSDTTSEAQA
jgi:phosphatidylglycerol:prolipoprotein diacylglycerol transferase